MKPHFLPYQQRWLADKSKIKFWEKSRRIGATYVQAYEDAEDMAAGRYPNVWFSSADESAAKEYIINCAAWAKYLQIGADVLGVVVIDKERDIKATTIQFANGCRINALSSNPKAFRSKGGKVILDEFAFHDDANALYKAALPTITWGYPLRILSTHNGQSCLYYRLLKKIRSGSLKWSLHSTPIQLAVDEGLADKILGRKLSKAEREEWLRQIHADCADEDTWNQEYCCIAIDESTALLPYDLIATCESDDVLWDNSGSGSVRGDLYIGMDIARHHDLSVIVTCEKLGDVLYMRAMDIMANTPWRIQRQVLFSRLGQPNMRRACIDASGMGHQLSEEAQDQFGRYRVEQVVFTNTVKEELAMPVKSRMEDRRIVIPSQFDLREDFHSIRKIVTAAGNVRFDAERCETTGHADRFWATALACHAAYVGQSTEIRINTGMRRKSMAGLD
jgi:phage FluMu gp28-like protein